MEKFKNKIKVKRLKKYISCWSCMRDCDKHKKHNCFKCMKKEYKIKKEGK